MLNGTHSLLAYARFLIGHPSARSSAPCCLDSAAALPHRIFQPTLQATMGGQDVRPFAFLAAMWVRFCLGTHDDETPHDVKDARGDELSQAIANAGTSAADNSQAIHALPNLIPPRLATNSAWRMHIETMLSSALQHGSRAAIQQEINEEDEHRARA